MISKQLAPDFKKKTMSRCIKTLVLGLISVTTFEQWI